MAINRREFLSTTLTTVAAASVLGSRFTFAATQHKAEHIGVQLYTVRDAMQQDMDGTLAKVAAIGYKEVEFGPTIENTKEARATLDRLGLTSPSGAFEYKDMIENLDAAAAKKEQPMLVWRNRSAQLIGNGPSGGTREAFEFAMSRTQTRAAEFAAEKGISIANASMKFKQLWEQGFLLRRESTADTGGLEFVYHRIG